VNKQLNDAIERVKSLPDDRQREAAEILLDFVEDQNRDVLLTQEQIAEIERRLRDDEPFASVEEVRAVIDRLTK
jgi:hypothetical protein